jgi:hypothetical protein
MVEDKGDKEKANYQRYSLIGCQKEERRCFEKSLR